MKIHNFFALTTTFREFFLRILIFRRDCSGFRCVDCAVLVGRKNIPNAIIAPRIKCANKVFFFQQGRIFMSTRLRAHKKALKIFKLNGERLLARRCFRKQDGSLSEIFQGGGGGWRVLRLSQKRANDDDSHELCSPQLYEI